MRLTLATLAAVATTVVAQGVTEILTPTSGPPAKCNPSYNGKFELTVVKSSAKRGIEERQKSGLLTCTLENGILTDSDNRTGYIASNYQFQFDGPPQAGAIYTAGWTVCSNDSLALGGSTIFWQCLSGSFYNLYDRYWAGQCESVNLNIIPLSGSGTTPVASSGASQTGSASGSASVISENSNGAPVATGAVNSTALITASRNISMTATPTASSSSGSAAATGASGSGSGTGTAASSTSSGLAAIATPLANLGALAVGLIGAIAVL